MATTIAQEIAARFHDNGQCWRDADGAEIMDVCDQAATERRRDGSTQVYGFADGSAILVTEGWWDVAPKAATYRIVTISGRGLPTEVDADGYTTRLAAETMAESSHDGEYRIEECA